MSTEQKPTTVVSLHDRDVAAVATLKSLGYTHAGGVRWIPPLGKKPDFDRIDAQQAEIDRLQHLLSELLEAADDVYCDWSAGTNDGRAMERLRILLGREVCPI